MGAMRAIVVAGLVVWAHVAAASTVVVLSDPQSAPALGSALQVTLAGRGVAIATLPAPDGSLRMDRAAAAQHAAISFNADAALWIDRDVDATEVCAVSADGRFFRHAPLPVGEGDTPRMFAAIATSLLDELVSAEPPAVDVDVHVHVAPDGHPVVAAAEPPGLAEPQVIEHALPETRPRMDRTLIEVGPALSPVTVGVEASAMVPISPSWRVGGTAMLDAVLANSTHDVLAVGLAELRHIGRGRHHWDVGPIAGYALVPMHTSDSATVFGARIAYAWEGEHHGSSIAISPLLFMVDTSNVLPGFYVSYHLELPL